MTEPIRITVQPITRSKGKRGNTVHVHCPYCNRVHAHRITRTARYCTAPCNPGAGLGYTIANPETP